jgi:hypothetical protein
MIASASTADGLGQLAGVLILAACNPFSSGRWSRR